MARRRKTKAERDLERDERDRRAWEIFRPQLEKIRCLAEAKSVLSGIPLPDSPGRKYYTNLLWFMDTFSPPGGSSAEEKRLYIEIVKGMDVAGELKEGVAPRVEESLKTAIEKQGYW